MNYGQVDSRKSKAKSEKGRESKHCSISGVCRREGRKKQIPRCARNDTFTPGRQAVVPAVNYGEVDSR
jgi:hypothetical protein